MQAQIPQAHVFIEQCGIVALLRRRQFSFHFLFKYDRGSASLWRRFRARSCCQNGVLPRCNCSLTVCCAVGDSVVMASRTPSGVEGSATLIFSERCLTGTAHLRRPRVALPCIKGANQPLHCRGQLKWCLSVQATWRPIIPTLRLADYRGV